MGMVWRALTMAAALICALSAMSAHAGLYSFEASGTIETSNIAAIPVGTPWTLDLIYDTDAPDLDFELTNTGAPDPTFGRFTNTDTPPALDFFHFQAGSYAATVNGPAAFGAFTEIDVTFTNGDAITIGIVAPDSVPQLPGGRVFISAGFNSSSPIFTSDRLPTNTALGPGSFDQSTVSVLTHSGVRFVEVDGHTLTSLKVTPLPEPSSAALAIPGALVVFGLATRRTRRLADLVPASRSRSRA